MNRIKISAHISQQKPPGNQLSHCTNVSAESVLNLLVFSKSEDYLENDSTVGKRRGCMHSSINGGPGVD